MTSKKLGFTLLNQTCRILLLHLPRCHPEGVERPKDLFKKGSMTEKDSCQKASLTGGYALLIGGCALKQHKRAGSLAVSILLGTYFASVLTELSEDMAFLHYVSPFKYFDPLLMLRESRLVVGFALLSLLITAVALVGAYFAYSKRDLYNLAQVANYKRALNLSKVAHIPRHERLGYKEGGRRGIFRRSPLRVTFFNFFHLAQMGKEKVGCA